MKTSIDDIQACFFPLIYFINTAEKTIDIAVMNINIKEIFTALMLKLNEGVVVRIMLDLSHSVLTPLMALRKKGMKIYTTYGFQLECNNIYVIGAKILLYNQTNSIMHYKFAVKDSCYMVTGSMNWSDLSTYYKYDHYVFTSVKHVVKSYEDAFQETWEMIENRNEHYKC